MFELIIESSVFMKTIIACCFFGVISWIVLAFSYRSMIKATAQIGKSKKKWLVSLRKKYEDYHEMNVKVNNVCTFVDRLYRKKKVCGLPCAFWQTLERLSIAACAIVGAVGALVSSQRGADLTTVLTMYLTGITTACGLIFLYILLRPDEKRHRIIVNMNDYLENVLENSLQGMAVVEDAGNLKERRRRLSNYAKENGTKKRRSEKVSVEEEKLLEDVLQEFFA